MVPALVEFPVQLKKWGHVAHDKCAMVTVTQDSIRRKCSVIWGDTALKDSRLSAMEQERSIRQAGVRRCFDWAGDFYGKEVAGS